LLVVTGFFAGDAILFVDPFAEIDELTPLRTKGTIGVFFPTD
jgi:hypothetical protein